MPKAFTLHSTGSLASHIMCLISEANVCLKVDVGFWYGFLKHVKQCSHRAMIMCDIAIDKAIERNNQSGNTPLFRPRTFIEMVIDGKGVFLVSTKFKHAYYISLAMGIFSYQNLSQCPVGTLIFDGLR